MAETSATARTLARVSRGNSSPVRIEAVMAGTRVVLTYRDYAVLPNGGRRYEIHDGELPGLDLRDLVEEQDLERTRRLRRSSPSAKSYACWLGRPSGGPKLVGERTTGIYKSPKPAGSIETAISVSNRRGCFPKMSENRWKGNIGSTRPGKGVVQYLQQSQRPSQMD